ncbi:uncharacterized protein LOC135385273 [Ornithodoros turicata]|uniref:uncharacterized protein LOC135385273 n=1 Tax=Ornithodoros turicata TaxID=34597 RepID=UPI003138ECA8
MSGASKKSPTETPEKTEEVSSGEVPVKTPDSYKTPDAVAGKPTSATKTPDKPTIKSPSKTQEEPTFKTPMKTPDKSSYHTPDEPANKSPSKAQDEPTFKTPMKTPDKSSYHTPDEPANKSPSKAQDEPTFKTPMKTPDKSSYRTPDEPANKSPSQSTKKSPDKSPRTATDVTGGAEGTPGQAVKGDASKLSSAASSEEKAIAEDRSVHESSKESLGSKPGAVPDSGTPSRSPKLAGAADVSQDASKSAVQTPQSQAPGKAAANETSEQFLSEKSVSDNIATEKPNAEKAATQDQAAVQSPAGKPESPAEPMSEIPKASPKDKATTAEKPKSKSPSKEQSARDEVKMDKSDVSKEGSKISANANEEAKTPADSVGSDEEDMRGPVKSHLLDSPAREQASPGSRSPLFQKPEPEVKVEKATPVLASPISRTYPAMSEREFINRIGEKTPRPTEGLVMKDPIRVLVTAASTELSYLMLAPIARGDVFGLDQPLFLHLYDQSENTTELQGVAMEIEDCSFPLLKQVIATGEDEVAFLDIDVAFLNDTAQVDDRVAFVRCVETYAGHGRSLAAYARKNVKILISGAPAETNAFIALRYAKGISYENFSALARLNYNRAVTLVSQALGVIPNKIVNMIVWGHKRQMLLADYSKSVVMKKSRKYRVSDLVSQEYLQFGLGRDLQTREEVIERLTKRPGMISRVKAACDQMRDWWIGLPIGQYVSMGVLSDGVYGAATHVMFSYPVTIDNRKNWKIVQNLAIDDHIRDCISDASKDLERERDEALEICDELGI